MFRLPKSSNQLTKKKHSNLVAETVVKPNKNQGLCKFSHRKCNFMCLENYNYCMKHILEDKSSPYKPCMFLYTVSGKKCGKPALRQERKDTWFCAEHNRKTQLQKQRASSRHAPPKTQEALFATFGHYVPCDQPAVKKDPDSDDLTEKQDTKVVDPFVDIDASKVNNGVNQVLEYVSESDSDVETAMLDSVWRAQDQESSDAESVDSQNEDPLKHAGIYTAEEVTIIIKDKMLRLQSLYIDQFRRLHHLLKEKRRKYLHSLKKEKETLSSIHDQEKNTAKEQKLYQKLKALNRYHRHHGVEAILYKKALELRAQVTEGHQLRTSHKGKCAFTEGGVKCGAKTLPVTKYCRKHILEDTQQVLFRSCGVKRDDHICQEPTLNVFENATCVYHTVLPAQPHHNTLAKIDHKENQLAEINNVQVTQTDTGAFVNYVDSEEIKDNLNLIKDILKPTGIDSSGKPETVDALELSRTVSDILALAEAHTDSADMGEIPEKSFIETSIQASGNEVSKSVFDQCITSSSNESIKPITDQIINTSPSETSKSVINQNLNTPAYESTESITDPFVDFSSSETTKSVIGKNSEVSSSETLDSSKPGPCEGMDYEEEKINISQSKESPKEDNSQDLLMVDMMSDVGVVEEVLDSEQGVVDLIEEVVSSEQEGYNKDASGFDQQTQVSGQQVMVSEDQNITSLEQVVRPEEDVLLSEQDVEAAIQQRRASQVVSEHQYAEISHLGVGTDQKKRVVCDDHGIGSEQDMEETEVPVPEKDAANTVLNTTSLDQERKTEEEPMEVDPKIESNPENG